MIARSIRQFAKSTLFLHHQFSTTKPNFETFQQLLNKGDAASIKQANNILTSLQKEYNTLSSKLQQIKDESSLIKNSEQGLKHKLEQLKVNVKQQQEQNKLVEMRINKQIKNAEDYSITKIAKELLDVADNMKRCAAESKKINSGKEDEFSLKLKQAHSALVESFKKFGIKEFDPTGEQYNPNTSESMVEIPDANQQDGKVAMTTQTGYMIKDRVIRSAKVCVYRN